MKNKQLPKFNYAIKLYAANNILLDVTMVNTNRTLLYRDKTNTI